MNGKGDRNRTSNASAFRDNWARTYRRRKLIAIAKVVIALALFCAGYVSGYLGGHGDGWSDRSLAMCYELHARGFDGGFVGSESEILGIRYLSEISASCLRPAEE